MCISDKVYTRAQILAKEKAILNKMEWNLTVPTQYVFLLRFVKAALSDKEMEHMVYFFAELGLMQYSLIMYPTSMVAAAAVYAARCTLQKSPLWGDTLKHHTGFSEPQLLQEVWGGGSKTRELLDPELKLLELQEESSMLVVLDVGLQCTRTAQAERPTSRQVSDLLRHTSLRSNNVGSGKKLDYH